MARSDRTQDPHIHPNTTVEEAARRRDRGERRVRLTTRWAVAAAVAGTAALGAGYAHAIPGSSAKPAPSTPPATAPSGGAGSQVTPDHSPTAAPGGSASAKPSAPSKSAKQAKPSGGLRTPAQPPAPTKQPPQTTSGGS